MAEDDGASYKLKGVATIQFFDGTIREAEIHWYEAHGIGRKKYGGVVHQRPFALHYITQTNPK